MASASNPSAVDPDADRDGGDDGDERVLSNGQAEGVLLRAIGVGDETQDVLADLRADMRCDPATLPDERVEALDDVVGELEAFVDDLRDLEPKGERDGE